MPERGETLTEAMLAQGRPVRGEGGRSLRAYCPFHGGDRQRSLRVELESGRFQCFSCGVWGYTETAREQYTSSLKSKPQPRLGAGVRATSPPRLPRRRIAGPSRVDGAILSLLAEYQSALPGSMGQEYLEERGIPLEFAQRFGIGYAEAGTWAHRGERNQPVRDYEFGRLVFPHMAPVGDGVEIVNLYGRALGERASKALRHDHLSGTKGYFNWGVMKEGSPVYVCEGPFDALSLMLVEPGLAAVAIFGVSGWRYEWMGQARSFVFALDADQAGQRAWKELARELRLRGRQVQYLGGDAYGGAKDANEAFVSGVLKIG